MLYNSTSKQTGVVFHYIRTMFFRHLAEILKAEEDSTNTGQSGVVFMDLGRTKWNEPNGTSGKELIRVANLLVSRVFYDFCRDKYWIKAVQTKIQNKLATIHLPYFIETLELSSFNIGTGSINGAR